MDIRFEKTASLKNRPADENALGFGAIFTDHMFVMDYESKKGWFDPRIQPFQDIPLPPSAAVFHYGQEIFEGLKAYSAGGDVLLFRPRDNARRFNRSADRMCMPQISEDIFCEALNALVDAERLWVPKSAGTSLYLRPTMIASGAGLSVHPSDRYMFFIICSPSGAYYPRGLEPIQIYVEDRYTRASAGGTGFAKTGGNYAGSLKASKEAQEKGYEQVLWLDGAEMKYVEEVGSMNMMFIIDGVLCTAPLEGSILAGVTRDSILTLAKEMGLEVKERRMTISELMKAGKDGSLQEAFGTGTAAVVSPVGGLAYKNDSVTVNGGRIGLWTKKLYDALTSIQTGKTPDAHGWVSAVKAGYRSTH